MPGSFGVGLAEVIAQDEHESLLQCDEIVNGWRRSCVCGNVWSTGRLGTMTDRHAADIKSLLSIRQLNTRSRSGMALEQNWKASPMHACLSNKVSALALPHVAIREVMRIAMTAVQTSVPLVAMIHLLTIVPGAPGLKSTSRFLFHRSRSSHYARVDLPSVSVDAAKPSDRARGVVFPLPHPRRRKAKRR